MLRRGSLGSFTTPPPYTIQPSSPFMDRQYLIRISSIQSPSCTVFQPFSTDHLDYADHDSHRSCPTPVNIDPHGLHTSTLYTTTIVNQCVKSQCRSHPGHDSNPSPSNSSNPSSCTVSNSTSPARPSTSPERSPTPYSTHGWSGWRSAAITMVRALAAFWLRTIYPRR